MVGKTRGAGRGGASLKAGSLTGLQPAGRTIGGRTPQRRWQNSANKMAESLQAMLPLDMVHTPLLVSRKSKRVQNSLNQQAPEAMVSKRLLASCSLVLLDLGRPTAAHCDCSSTYTEQPRLLSWMWANVRSH